MNVETAPLSTREIMCLMRLDRVAGSIPEIIEFLVSEKLIHRDDAQKLARSPHRAKELHTVLHSLKVEEKIQLLEYHWQVLPTEHAVLTVVTDTTKKEFTYSA